MAKITEYATITATDAEAMDVAANEMIQEGWQPFGGVSVTRTNGDGLEDSDHLLAQAMVRYAE